tara:strand:+ start:4777 stop:5862 length:1086 start_codon:yes stop_codon:yes gene_type:complete
MMTGNSAIKTTLREDRMKRISFRNVRNMALATMAIGLFSASASVATAAETRTLRMGDTLPAASSLAKTMKEWTETVEARSDGRLKIQYFPGGQIVGAKDSLDLLLSGTVDIAYTPPLREASRLALSAVPALPGLPGGAVQLTEAYLNLLQGTLYDVELSDLGIVPLMAILTPQYEIMTVQKEVVGKSDMAGLKIRSAGGVQGETVKALGAVPVSISAPETYTALQRKTVDGALFSFYSVPIYKLDEVIGYSTTNANLGSYPIVYTINKSVWDSLEPDLQKILQETAREASIKTAQFSDDDAAANVEKYKDKIKPVEMTGADYTAWQEATSAVRDEWIKKNKADGLPADTLYDEWSKLVSGK